MDDGGAIRIGVVGAQFGDPVVFAEWLRYRHGARLRIETVGEHDKILCSAPFTVGPVTVKVVSAVPAYMDLPTVFRSVLADSDVAVLMLPRAEGLLELNEAPIREVARWGGPIIAVVNDPYCEGAGHESLPSPEWLRLVEPGRVAAMLPSQWPVHVTRIGSFFPERVRCEEGAEAVLGAAIGLRKP